MRWEEGYGLLSLRAVQMLSGMQALVRSEGGTTGRHLERSPRAWPSTQENQTSLWTGSGEWGGPGEAQNYRESRARSQNSLPL